MGNNTWEAVICVFMLFLGLIFLNVAAPLAKLFGIILVVLGLAFMVDLFVDFIEDVKPRKRR